MKAAKIKELKEVDRLKKKNSDLIDQFHFKHRISTDNINVIFNLEFIIKSLIILNN